MPILALNRECYLAPTPTQDRIGVIVDLRATFNNDYFVVGVTNKARAGHNDITEQAWDEKVQQVMQHIWDKLLDHGMVNGVLPTIHKVHPLDMLPPEGLWA